MRVQGELGLVSSEGANRLPITDGVGSNACATKGTNARDMRPQGGGGTWAFFVGAAPDWAMWAERAMTKERVRCQAKTVTRQTYSRGSKVPGQSKRSTLRGCGGGGGRSGTRTVA